MFHSGTPIENLAYPPREADTAASWR